MLIDDLETKTPRAGGKEKSHTQNINVPSTSRATTTRIPTKPGDKHRGNQCIEPCTTVAISRRTSRRTRNHSVLDIGRKDSDYVYVAAPMAQQDREGKIPSNTPQTFDNDENEHRKRRHQFGIDPDLLRWLREDPARLPKAREDMARWTKYMATEMSNPAFQLFISMAKNFKPPKNPLPATTPPTSTRK